MRSSQTETTKRADRNPTPGDVITWEVGVDEYGDGQGIKKI